MYNPLRAIFGTKHDRDVKRLKPLIQQINDLEPKIKELSDDELAAQTVKFRQRVNDGASLHDILPEAFATVREASVRTLGMRHFDVR